MRASRPPRDERRTWFFVQQQQHQPLRTSSTRRILHNIIVEATEEVNKSYPHLLNIFVSELLPRKEYAQKETEQINEYGCWNVSKFQPIVFYGNDTFFFINQILIFQESNVYTISQCLFSFQPTWFLLQPMNDKRSANIIFCNQIIFLPNQKYIYAGKFVCCQPIDKFIQPISIMNPFSLSHVTRMCEMTMVVWSGFYTYHIV